MDIVVTFLFHALLRIDQLQDPDALIIILTELLDLTWLGNFKATIVADLPNRENMVSVAITSGLVALRVTLTASCPS